MWPGARAWIPMLRARAFSVSRHRSAEVPIDWDDDRARRAWIASFCQQPLHPCKFFFIDPAHVLIHFARSSGPGGQNVNKRTCLATYLVNTKVYARFELGPRAPRALPPALVRQLAKRSVRFVVSHSASLCTYNLHTRSKYRVSGIVHSRRTSKMLWARYVYIYLCSCTRKLCVSHQTDCAERRRPSSANVWKY